MDHLLSIITRFRGFAGDLQGRKKENSDNKFRHRIKEMTYINQISETVTDQVQHSPVGRTCDFMLGRGSSRLAAWMPAVLESGSEPAALPNDSDHSDHMLFLSSV